MRNRKLRVLSRVVVVVTIVAVVAWLYFLIAGVVLDRPDYLTISWMFIAVSAVLALVLAAVWYIEWVNKQAHEEVRVLLPPEKWVAAGMALTRFLNDHEMSPPTQAELGHIRRIWCDGLIPGWFLPITNRLDAPGATVYGAWFRTPTNGDPRPVLFEVETGETLDWLAAEFLDTIREATDGRPEPKEEEQR